MSRILIPALEITKKRLVRKVRELPLAGEVLVEPGQQVSAKSIVLRAALPGELSILRIPEKLGVEVEEVQQLLKARNMAVGQTVKQGELIVEHAGLFGLFRSRFISPLSGTIEYVSESSAHIGVRQAPKQFELKAFIDGKVTSIVPQRSVTIEGVACYVQGIFGVGGERNGQLEILNCPSSKVLKPEDLPEQLTSKIIVGGTKPNADCLRAASKGGAVGFVTGSIDDQALKDYLGYDLGIALTGDEEISMSLIVTEGFGELAISDRVLETLATHHGKYASINGATQVRAGAVRPEIIVGLGSAEINQQDVLEPTRSGLELGAMVRVIRVPYFGQVGQVIDLPHSLHKIESGAMARVAVLKISGQEVVVPRANLELIQS